MTIFKVAADFTHCMDFKVILGDENMTRHFSEEKIIFSFKNNRKIVVTITFYRPASGANFFTRQYNVSWANILIETIVFPTFKWQSESQKEMLQDVLFAFNKLHRVPQRSAKIIMYNAWLTFGGAVAAATSRSTISTMAAPIVEIMGQLVAEPREIMTCL